MKLTSIPWSCLRCGAAFVSAPPEHGLCGQCLIDLDALASLAPLANEPCPTCGGPVCADCGKALITLLPTDPPIPPGLVRRPRRVSSDGR
jgi:hypothetical protein